MAQLSDFKEIWIVDFEFRSPKEGFPMSTAAWEARSNRLIRRFTKISLQLMKPFDVGNDALFVAYYSSAEFDASLVGLCRHTLDLYVEFRRLLAGREVCCFRFTRTPHFNLSQHAPSAKAEWET